MTEIEVGSEAPHKAENSTSTSYSRVGIVGGINRAS